MRFTVRSSRTSALTLSVRGLAQRFSHFIMIGLVAGFMLAGQVQPEAASHVRMAIVDMLAPFLRIAAAPVTSARQALGTVHDYLDMKSELVALRTQTTELAGWRDAALKAQAENDALRQLLNYKPEPKAEFLTAHILAASGTSIGHSLIVLAGSADGVRTDAMVATDRGLLGRIVEVGSRTGRVLLLTDINSRIPVWIEKSHDRAVLAGSNEGGPVLLYLPADADVTVGDRIVTSGQGGIFPAGIPVGAVSSRKGGQIAVALFADPATTDYVRIADYSGLIVPPAAAEDLGGKPPRAATSAPVAHRAAVHEIQAAEPAATPESDTDTGSEEDQEQ